MKQFCPLPFAFALVFAALPAIDAQAQRNALSAQEAVDLVSAQYGPQSIQWIAELRARGGVPQPADWEVLSYDPRMPRLLYRFWATAGRVVDGGPDEERYPINIPVGYFSPNQIGVDSIAAFTIAEGEARKARVSFDSCDYLLRVREYSTEPIWRLELFDSRNQIVGKIYISATSGAVMRTVWIYRDDRALSTVRPRIVDSFAPAGGAPSGAPVGPGFSTNTLIPTTPPADERMTGIAVAPIPDGPEPGQSTGIAQTPPRPAPAPYRPAQPGGSAVDNSIPDPPAAGGSGEMRDLRDPPAAGAPAAGAPAAGAPAAGAESTARPDPTRPPIEVPDSGGGSSERIPPPPIPQ